MRRSESGTNFGETVCNRLRIRLKRRRSLEKFRRQTPFLFARMLLGGDYEFLRQQAPHGGIIGLELVSVREDFQRCSVFSAHVQNGPEEDVGLHEVGT